MNENLILAQTEANYEARLILGIGSKEPLIGDLPTGLIAGFIQEERQKKLPIHIDGLYWCTRCQRNHFYDCEIGKKHLVKG